ncbi:MAG: hypothetical protein FJ102_09490 [Deltaproteobacteria bacterium]|nr:hypothetical protein [Deltaproteobacteria bacterium]
MHSWKTTIHPSRGRLRVLVTGPEGDEILKAALPPFPRHPRALLTLLESLSLWAGSPLAAAISAAPPLDWRCADALFGDGLFPPDRALVRLEVLPPTRPR